MGSIAETEILVAQTSRVIAESKQGLAWLLAQIALTQRQIENAQAQAQTCLKDLAKLRRGGTAP